MGVSAEGRNTLRTMVMRTALLPLLVALAVGLVGCSDKTAGNAQPSDQTTEESSPEPTEPTGRTTSSKPSSGDSPLADLNPCEWSAEGAAQLGVKGEGEERKVGSARTCRYRLDGATVADSFTISVGLYDTLGLKDLPSDANQTPVPTVGKHEAVKRLGAAGGCAIIMAVTDSSRADTSFTGGDQQKACDLALQLAKAIEPKLPE